MFELGNNLREARQRRRIDLVIAEQDTKIRSKYLAALETEDFDVLPGPVFVRGFLRTYSRYLGLDPQLFIDEYNARFGRFEDVEEHHSPALGRPGLAQAREVRGRRTMRVFVIASLVALALLAWLGLRDQEEPAAETVKPSHAQPVDPEPTADAALQPGALKSASNAAATTPPAGAGVSRTGSAGTGTSSSTTTATTRTR
jgi:cytoskeletal protein RodZ